MQAFEHAAKENDSDSAAGKTLLAHERTAAKPASHATLQRKAQCACSGDCPRCQTSALQPKLSISQPEETHEQEADRVAAQVLRTPVPESKPRPPERLDAPSLVGHASNSSGQPLHAEAREFFEPRFGRDLGDVRIHTDAHAAESTRAVNAAAYAVGRDIVFGKEEYQPQTEAGKHLLAHELAHVVHDSEKHVLHRSPKKQPPLDVDVPEAEEQFKPEFKYPWQNPALRKTIYPYRDEALSFFLRTYMEIDLDDPATPVTPVTADELDKERTRLSDELKTVNSEYAAAKKELKDAQKPGKGQTVDKEAVAALEARMKELVARAQRLDRDLKYLPTPKKGKGKDQTLKLPDQKSANRKWTAYSYSKLDDAGQDVDHDVLLGRILDRFDADKDFKRYPKWLRYMVIHFSGMRYQSAHGSYAPANDLLKRLKREQLNFELGSAPQSEIAEHSADAVSELEDELTADKKPGARRAKVIKSRLADLHAVEKEQKAAFSKKGEETKHEAFEKLTALEDERDKLKGQLAPSNVKWEQDLVQANLNRLKEIEPQIKALEDEIGAKSLTTVRKRVAAAEDKRRAAVIEHEIERADAEFSKLNDMQALSIIKAMRAKGAFPEWVWREIVRVTALKLEAQEDSDWETVTDEEQQEKSQKDTVTGKWRQVMKEWKKDVTGWREKHGDDLSLVVVRAVCNEVCEMSLHARGVDPAGGINQKAKWYSKSGGGASFSKPMKETDLNPGSSLFFLEWSNAAAKNTVNVVRSDLGVALKNEKNVTISDGFTDADGWHYHFNSDKTVTRTRDIATPMDATFVAPQETQHLNWTHEAMLVEVDSKRGRVITFETGPIGLDKRTLDKVLDHWNVYMGFAPTGKEPADIDEYFKGVLPNREKKNP